MAQPYPISRETREEAIYFGDGGAIYGPFDLKVADIEDVQIWIRALGAPSWSIATPTVTKTAGDPIDTFSIAFPFNVPATSRYKVLGKRTHERSAGVTNGTRIDPNALEKELTKMGMVLQELRRDVGRGIQVQFGDGLIMSDDLEDGDTLMKSGSQIVKGANAADITLAQAYAESAAESADQAQQAVGDVTTAGNTIVADAENARDLAISAAAATAWRVFPDQATAAATTIPSTATFVAIATYSPQPRFYRRFATNPGSGDRFQSADGAWWQGLPLPGTSIDYVNAVQRTANASLIAGDLDQAHRWTIPVGTVYTVTLPDPALHVGRILDIGVNSASRGRLAVAYTTNPIGKFASGGLFLWAGENMVLIARATEWEIIGGRCIPCALYATAPGPDIGMTSNVALNLTGWQTTQGGTMYTGAEHAINGSGQIVIPRQGFFELELDVGFAWSTVPTSLYASCDAAAILDRYFSRLQSTNDVLHPRKAGIFSAGTVLNPNALCVGGASVGVRSTTFGPPQFKLVESAQW